MARAFIGVGSSIDPERNVLEALKRLRRMARIVSISTFYRTEPIGRPGDPPFANGVVEIETDLPPRALKLEVLRRIEEELGRRRGADRYAPRTIDLDLLLYDELEAAAPDLVLPDPEISARAFLAIPLAELAPDLTLPGSGLRLREIAASQARGGMEAMVDFTQTLRRDNAHGP